MDYTLTEIQGEDLYLDSKINSTAERGVLVLSHRKLLKGLKNVKRLVLGFATKLINNRKHKQKPKGIKTRTC